jgi:dienelactone hydrolase
MRILLAALLLALSAPALPAQDKPAEGADTTIPENPNRAAFVVSLKDFGSDDIAYLSLPQNPPEAGFVFVPGLFGIDRTLKRVCDLMSANNFITLAVDLNNGRTPRDEGEARLNQKDIRPESALKTIASGIRFYDESPRFKCETVILAGSTENAALAATAVLANSQIKGLILLEPNALPDDETLDRLRVPLLIVASATDPVVSSRLDTLKELWARKKLPFVFSATNAAPGDFSRSPLDKKFAVQWAHCASFAKETATRPAAKPSLMDKIFD